MNDVGLRIKEIREQLGYTQSYFGELIGVGQSAIGLYEKQKRSVSETVKKSICREFNVNYLFLDAGVGDMFVDLPKTIIEELALQYDLDDSEKDLVKDFIKLSKEERKILMNFLKRT